MHAHSILIDLAWIMLSAALAALIFQRFKIPLLLGYLAAGFLVGPHLGLWPALVTLENVQELSELGVIFLLFYIGLEFDFSRLRQALGPALAALILQTLLMLFVGIEASRWLGLSAMDGWFLGGLLSISSSMVSVKLIRERSLIHRPYANLTIGVLVLEDILAIILLVLLGGMAVEGRMNVEAVGRSVLFIGIFVIVVFLLGKLGAQRIMKILEDRGSTEMITLTAVGLIFAIGLLAHQFDFSWALGGFLAGAILSGSQLAKRIEELTEPLRDLFSALFFVTVGMLIDPKALLDHLPAILGLSALVIVCKFSSCWLGFFLTGRPTLDATRAALIKSQIGEFSFVIVAIGAKYGATSSELQSIVSGIAFVTILTTPTLVYNEERLIRLANRLSPSPLKEFCSLYSQWIGTLSLSVGRNSFLVLAKKPLILICIHFFIIIAIIIAAGVVSRWAAVPDFLPMSQSLFQQSIFVLSVLISMPFLVDSMRNLNVLVWIFSDSALSRPAFQQFSRGIYRSAFNGLIMALLLFVYGMVILLVAAPYFPTGSAIVAFLASAVVVGWIFWKKLARMHHNWETAVVNSMKSAAQERIASKISTNLESLKSRQPWNVNVESIVLASDSKWSGAQVKDTNLRAETGTLIAGIERGGFEIVSIDPDTTLYPEDRIFLLGEPEQIERARAYLNTARPETAALMEDFVFTREVIPPRCEWNGMRIQDAQIRSRFNVTIVGIQRGDERIVGPSPQEILEEGDLILVMGSPDNLEIFKSELNRRDHGS